MAQLEDLGEVIKTDVLVIGGGLSGVVSALKAKEQDSSIDILIVDKATIGWAGHATKAGNGYWANRTEDIDTYVEQHARNIGEYLNDQERLYLYTSESYNSAEQLAAWGVSITKDAQGNIGTYRHPVAPFHSFSGIELDIMEVLRKQALKQQIKLLNKVQVTDLLTDNGRVIGAIGFNLIDMRFYIFKAKSIILASNACQYGLAGMFNGEGEGIAAAYRVGAEMRNAEIACAGGFFNEGAHIYGAEYLIFNAQGENMSHKYAPNAADVSTKLILGLEKELMEGRGPLYVDATQTDELRKVVGPQEEMLDGMVRYFPKKWAWENHMKAKAHKYGPPVTKPKIFLFSGVSSSPIKTDHDMKTNIPGLWTVGSAGWHGAAHHGAHSGPGGIRGGTGLGNATLSGLRAGISVGRSVSEATQGNIDAGEVKKLKENLFAPLKRDKGVQPAAVFGLIASVVAPLDQVLRRRKDRMEKALETVAEAEAMLPSLMAKDGHGLTKCVASQSIVLNAEMMHRAALMRTESRGSFYREDYPERDDKNWLKWIIVKNVNGKMTFSTEPVPIERYKYKP